MRKFLIISLLASSSIIFAGEAEDFKTVNELYKEKRIREIFGEISWVKTSKKYER